MKKQWIVMAGMSVLMLASATASAHDWQDDRYNKDHHWRQVKHNHVNVERGLPFAWHERYDSMRERHHLERIENREWEQRFPGLHAYRWSGREGFWHNGHYVKDAVLFYDQNHELVSVGYMANGVFIHFRDDHRSFENRDSFFVSIFRHR
ncbi:MAG: hypothetical protein LLG02_07275 [Pelosinus sp.]|nr:hypothetical protein [Pelosinus sp.]